MERSALATPPFGPVGLDFCSLGRIGQRLFIVPQRGIGAGSVRVQDVVGGVKLDSLRELLAVAVVSETMAAKGVFAGNSHGLGELLLRKELVAFRLERVGHFVYACGNAY